MFPDVWTSQLIMGYLILKGAIAKIYNNWRGDSCHKIPPNLQKKVTLTERTQSWSKFWYERFQLVIIISWKFDENWLKTEGGVADTKFYKAYKEK